MDRLHYLDHQLISCHRFMVLLFYVFFSIPMFLLVMVALCTRADHYIFALLFLSSIYLLFFSPNVSRRKLDVYHTLTHGVALVRI